MRFSVPILVLILTLSFGSHAYAAGVVSTCDEASLNTALTGGGVVTFSCSGTITVTSTKTIAINTTIDGTGQNVIISGGNSVQIFVVNTGITLNITQMTISDGSGTDGGAISSQGTVNILQSTFSNNTATGAAFSAGGAIYQSGGVLSVDSSTFNGNSAEVGGAVSAENSAFTTFENSTFSSNIATFNGGALNFTDTGTGGNIEFSTFRGNNNPGSADINATQDASVAIKHSILAESIGNSCRANNFATITPFGVNFEADGSCVAINPTFTQVTDAQLNLEALADNGGFTQTHALGPGSVAIDATSDCTDIFSVGVSADQRGTSRPQPAAGDCDVGAVEMTQPDLTASKSNDTSGAHVLGGSFDWDIELRLANSTPAIFAQNDVIFEDDLPGTPGSTINYSSLSSSNVGTIGGTGSINCSLTTATIECTASGGTVSIGAMSSGFDISITAMPLATGNFSNPNGTCRVDPDNELVETNDESMGTDNNACSNSVSVTAPNLGVSKSNDTSDVAIVGDTFEWTLSVTNTGAEDATFASGEEILSDELSSDATYGTPSISGDVDISGTGTINCNIDGTPDLVCTASGGTVIIESATGTFDVDFQATPNSATSPLINPRSSSTCEVDPNNEIVEGNENDNTCSDSITIQSPNLSISKANDTSDLGKIGVPYDWTLSVSNDGTAAANFANGDVILRDELPVDASYGSPNVSNEVGITGTIDCSVDGTPHLVCTANGAVTIASGTGAFDVTVEVTPNIATGQLDNPRSGGTCEVDPDDNITESNESDNDCNSDSVMLEPPVVKLSSPETINVRNSFSIPFWCGERKDDFMMGGVEFTNLEQYETEIEIIFPQKRILLVFPGPQEIAQLIETATITEPSDFQTPGVMSIPILNQIESGKTTRLGCNEVTALPTRLDDAGDIDQFLSQVISSEDFFHGMLTLESDNRNLKVFVNKIVRSWKCTDEGGGLDCHKGKQSRERLKIEPTTTNVVRAVQFEVEQPPIMASSVKQKISHPLELSTQQSHGELKLSVISQNAQEVSVALFSLQGEKLNEAHERGNSLNLRLRTSTGKVLANGVYLYLVTVRDTEGNMLTSEIRKLVVLR